MNEERDWAAYYEQHRDDPDMWGEPEEDVRPVRRRGLSATITVRFSAEEASEIREVAKEIEVSYSGLVRTAVRGFVHSYLVAKHEAGSVTSGRQEPVPPAPEDRRGLSASNAPTSTGSGALALA